MLAFLRGKASDRKLRLFSCACGRRFLHLIQDPRVSEALDTAERFADGLVGEKERSQARRAAQQAAQVRGVVARPEAPKWERRAASLGYYAAARQAIEAAWNAPGLAVEVLVWRAGGYSTCDWQAVRTTEVAIHADLLRDVFPYRSSPPLLPAVLSWNDRTVPRIAQRIYEERRMPEGTLDAARLAVLADALLDAGSDDEALIRHCREPGPTFGVAGSSTCCWARNRLRGDARGRAVPTPPTGEGDPCNTTP
jgi:hypothetical protein